MKDMTDSSENHFDPVSGIVRWRWSTFRSSLTRNVFPSVRLTVKVFHGPQQCGRTIPIWFRSVLVAASFNQLLCWGGRPYHLAWAGWSATLQFRKPKHSRSTNARAVLPSLVNEARERTRCLVADGRDSEERRGDGADLRHWGGEWWGKVKT
ncbi:hypothetical protein C8R44DRAFT_746757 [Mycena epipterygia]|nr:hypothetical protein C8R44DRAFT_746757 [Mycena epipterygia]